MPLLLRRFGLPRLLRLRLRHFPILPNLRYPPLQTKHPLDQAQVRYASSASKALVLSKIQLRVPQSERIIQDLNVQKRYIEQLRNNSSFTTEDLTAISELFTQAVELASSDLSQEAYRFVIRLWLAVFKEHKGGPNLQKILLQSRSRVANLCINNLDYKGYLECSAPLPNRPLWADIVARTLQLQILNKGELQFSNTSITAYLRGLESQENKRRMLAAFLRKTLLYSRLNHDFPRILTAFVKFAADVGDGELFLAAPEHAVYHKALALLASPRGSSSVASHIHLIEGVLMRSEYGNKTTLSNLLSTLMLVKVSTQPSVALEYFNFKEEMSLGGYKVNEYLTQHDLLVAMWGLFLSNKYPECLELYRKYPSLHGDDQIDIFLRISEKSKDWLQLQKQFEDMYGQGDLPYVQHYAIVMNALASIKVVKEVDELYDQLLKRNLTPSCEIHAAVIKSRIAVKDYDGAQAKFEDFLERYEKGAVLPGSVARVHALIFDLHLHSSSVPELMKALQEVMKRQKKSSVPLIDTKLLCNVISAVGANFGVSELDELWELAERFSMKTEEVYEKMINALTRFGEYEKADKLTFEAHLQSTVPFTSSLIAKAQLKNLRSWYNASTDRELKPFLSAKTKTILRRLNTDKVSLKNRPNLLIEAIKFELSINRRKTARAYLDQAKALEAVTEQHYLPFLKYYCQGKSYQGASTVLELYREMAAEKIDITSNSYVYLIRALIEIDRANSDSYNHSYKLLESVFELYGLSMFEHIKPLRTSSGDMHYHAENLLKIVTTYVTATSSLVLNMDLVVHFLNQMRDRLGDRIPLRFRMTIFKEMAILYRLSGDNLTAKKMILKALTEVHDVTDHFRKGSDLVETPKLLQLDYRQIVEIMLPIYRGLQTPPEEYEEWAVFLLQRNVHLGGPLFRPIIEHIMKGEASEEKVKVILDICERFLVSGTWVTVKIEKKQQYIYKLFILFLTRRMPEKRILENYSIFNKFYNVWSINELRKEFKNIDNYAGALQQALDEYGQQTAFSWNVSTLLKDPHKFFLPGRSIASRNVMDPRMTAKLYAFIGKYCEDDKTKAFRLYDDFPETMDYLLYYGQARTRLQAFRNEIDKIQPPLASSENEGRKYRRFRTFRVLRNSMKLLSR